MSIAYRAFLALLLTVGFYLLACGIAVGLFAIVYLDVAVGHRVDARLDLFALIGAGLILWSIVPRRVPFVEPGPRLDLSAHPLLREQLVDVAARVGEPLPGEVYVDLAMNAGVLQRGGLLGIGSRRVIVLGLPLLQLLTISEMRAVLAHEFGHYHGGDTAIGPWVYRTRQSIVRTVRRVGRFSSLLHLPFRQYGLLFLRITQAVSRSQEFAADRLAARAAGARAMTSALGKLDEGSLALQLYMQSEFVPVVNAGLRPPLVDGFAHFLSQPPVREQLHRAVSEQSAGAVPRPYDSHPATRDRVAALAGLEPGPDPSGEVAAIGLLGQVPTLEQEALMRHLRPGAPPLQDLAWDQVGIRFVLPFWRRVVEEHGALLGAAAVIDLPAWARQAAALGYRIPNANADGGQDWARRAGGRLLTAALGVALSHQGWSVESRPGEPIALSMGPTTLDPVKVVDDMAEGRFDDAAWADWCQEARLTRVPLNVAPATAAPGTAVG
jgi:Zn-dependent protease with chaperone function